MRSSRLLPVVASALLFWAATARAQPTPAQGWAVAPFKQPACRHNGRAVFSCCDGHVESWKWKDLRNNKDDAFEINSL